MPQCKVEKKQKTLVVVPSFPPAQEIISLHQLAIVAEKPKTAGTE
jgi:hypothetical protein